MQRKAVWICFISLLLILSYIERPLTQTDIADAFDEQGEYVISVAIDDSFVTADEQAVSSLLKDGTGILLIGSATDSHTQVTAAFLSKFGHSKGVAGILYASQCPDDCFRMLKSYIQKNDTGFANVTGSASLIEKLCAADSAEEMQGIIVFALKGTIVGVQAAVEMANTTDVNQLSEDICRQFESDIERYISMLNSEPCPGHC